jgi:hypothetical protein
MLTLLKRTYPGFEPGIFGLAVSIANHYTIYVVDRFPCLKKFVLNNFRRSYSQSFFLIFLESLTSFNRCYAKTYDGYFFVYFCCLLKITLGNFCEFNEKMVFFHGIFHLFIHCKKKTKKIKLFGSYINVRLNCRLPDGLYKSFWQGPLAGIMHVFLFLIFIFKSI